MESLNVDAVVMSSVLDGNHGNSSGSADVGYQVVNYNNIDALFGDLQDMDDLITEAHDRGNMIYFLKIFCNVSESLVITIQFVSFGGNQKIDLVLKTRKNRLMEKASQLKLLVC